MRKKKKTRQEHRAETNKLNSFFVKKPNIVQLNPFQVSFFKFRARSKIWFFGTRVQEKIN